MKVWINFFTCQNRRKYCFCQNSGLKFPRATGYSVSINVSVDNFLLLKRYSTVQYCVLFFRREFLCANFVYFYMFVWIVWMRRLLFSQRYLLKFFYHGINQRISFCRTSFTNNVLGKYHCIAIFTDRFNENVELVWFFVKNKPDLIKSPWLLLFHNGITRHFSILVKLNGIINCYI